MYFMELVLLLVILVAVSMVIQKLMKENREAHDHQEMHHHKIEKYLKKLYKYKKQLEHQLITPSQESRQIFHRIGDKLDVFERGGLHGLVLRDGNIMQVLGASPQANDIYQVPKLLQIRLVGTGEASQEVSYIDQMYIIDEPALQLQNLVGKGPKHFKETYSSIFDSVKKNLKKQFDEKVAPELKKQAKAVISKGVDAIVKKSQETIDKHETSRFTGMFQGL